MSPVSAFAARQARQKVRYPPTPIDAADAVQEALPSAQRTSSGSTEPLDDQQGAGQPSRRKRKRNLDRKDTVVQHAEFDSRDNTTASESIDIITTTPAEPVDLNHHMYSSEDSSVPDDKTMFKPPERRLCSVNAPTIIADLGKEGYVVSLGPRESLAFSGLYTFRVDKGVVRVLGATIKASSKLYQVFAPSTNCLPVIEHVQNPFDPTMSAEIGVLSTQPEVKKLSRLSPLFDIIWNYEGANINRSFSFLRTSADDLKRRNLRAFEPLSSWRSLLLRLTDPSKTQSRKVMVCGPKGAGKSTFVRFLTNAMISIPSLGEGSRSPGIAFLDLDPGQPEFSPPGDVSLVTLKEFILGPPFCHPTVLEGSTSRLERAHHIGNVSPKEDIQHYMECAKDLCSVQRRQSPRPLLVNTCGWTQGPGLDILEELVSSLELTDIVWMSKSGPMEAIEALHQRAQDCGTALHLLDSQPLEPATRAPVDLRAMQTMSYFHLDVPILGTPYWDPKSKHPSSGQRLRYGGPEPDVLGIMQLGNEINPRFLQRVIDGTVLSIVAIEDKSCLPESVFVDPGDETLCYNASSSAPLSYSDDVYRLPYLFLGSGACDPLPPTKTRSLGQILISEIDSKTKSMFVHTPLNLSQVFETARSTDTPLVLVRGHLDIPAWFYTESYYATRARASTAKEYWAVRNAELAEKGGKINGHGAGGPDGGERTRDEDLVLSADGTVEEELSAESWANTQRWVQVVARDGQGGTRKRGEKVWRARRNLVVKDGSRK